MIVSMPWCCTFGAWFYLLLAFSPSHAFGNLFDKYFDVRLCFLCRSRYLIGYLQFAVYGLSFTIGFSALPPTMREASFSGKSTFKTLMSVLLPNIKPSVLTALVLTFAHTVGEFGVVLMIGGNIPGETKSCIHRYL